MVNKILSTKVSAAINSFAIFLLRVGLGVLMIPHGYQKLIHFSEYQMKFMDFLGLGSSITLGLTIGAEFFCSILLVVGLFTRFSLIPLIVAMVVAVFKAHHGDVFGDGEHGLLYLIGYVAIFLAGAGRFSLDALVLRK